MRTALLTASFLTACTVLFAAPLSAAMQITGAGASFPYPFFSKAFYAYGQQHGDVFVNYQSIGSGGGIEQFTAKTVDFGASDVPMTPEELRRASSSGGSVIQFPTTLGGITIAYNLPATVRGGLRLTRELLAQIYLGRISRWNDAQLARLNPGASLPDLEIVPVNRSDASGTTYHFTDFLSRVSAEWKSRVGNAKSVQWPAANGIAAKGNEGVAGAVKQTPGAIGYVELAYALENKMTQADLRNRSGRWLSCEPATIKAAAATKPTLSATDFSIVDVAGESAWPISGFSWGMVYESPADRPRARLVHDVLTWLVTQAQPIAATLGYVPLPQNVASLAVRQLDRMKVDGR